MSDVNIQTFSGKVNVSNNFTVGSGHLFVDTQDNKVGLNTATPNSSLHVNGNAYVATDITFGGILSGDGSGLRNVGSGSWSSGTGNVYLSTSTDNVGIGTSEPPTKLTVSGSSGGAPPTTGGEGTSNGIFRIRDDYNVALDFGTLGVLPWSSWIQAQDATSMNTTYPLSLNPNGGNVGIGTTNPGQKLSIFTGSTSTAALSFDRYGSGNYRTDIYQNSYGADFRVGYGNYTPESLLYLKRFSNGAKEVEINGELHIAKDGVVADFTPATAGSYTLMNFNSKRNNGSDKGFILVEDETVYSPGTSTEDLRMTIGVYNDFRQSTSHSDELWLQGGGRLCYNVGSWDPRLNSIIGTPGAGSSHGGPAHEWRINNGYVMELDGDGLKMQTGKRFECDTIRTTLSSSRQVYCKNEYHQMSQGVYKRVVGSRFTGLIIWTALDNDKSSAVFHVAENSNAVSGTITVTRRMTDYYSGSIYIDYRWNGGYLEFHRQGTTSYSGYYVTVIGAIVA